MDSVSTDLRAVSDYNSGSPQGQHGLQTLAAVLDVDTRALKIALEAAFYLVPYVGTPGLALQMSLARLGYRFQSRAFYDAIRAFSTEILRVQQGNSSCYPKIDLKLLPAC